MRREHMHSWMLFALLLSAKKDFERALTVCRTGVQLFPDEIRLLHLRARLEAATGNNEAALKTYAPPECTSAAHLRPQCVGCVQGAAHA